MPRIFLTHTDHARATFFGAGNLKSICELGRVSMNTSGRVLCGEELAEAAKDAQIILLDRQTPADSVFLRQVPKLAALLSCVVDLRRVDLVAADSLGILVTRSRPFYAEAVAELAIGMMIDLARGISSAQTAWPDQPVPRLGRQLAGATIGIVGYGLIGRHLAACTEALGMRVYFYDPSVEACRPEHRKVPLRELLTVSDYVVCLMSVAVGAPALFNARSFTVMKPGSFFINLSRAGAVDEDALATALDSGHLAGAALDVGSGPDELPPRALAKRADVIATPHIGGLTPEAAFTQSAFVVKQTATLISGEQPPEAVNPAAASRIKELFGKGA